MTRSLLLVFLTFVTIGIAHSQNFTEPCDHIIYCQGPVLETIQLSKIFNESKTFVDLPLRHSPEQVLSSFLSLGCSGDVSGDLYCLQKVFEFLLVNFDPPGHEFIPFTFEDWTENPSFLTSIQDLELRCFGSELHRIWNELGRKIKPEVENDTKTSMIYSPNPVVVPGGRFREFYYWDSYWIQQGLLVSGMHETVKGMIDNFLIMVDKLGYVPNGGRIYYERSQPPLLLPMIKAYFDKTRDLSYIQENIRLMEKEFDFFMKERMITFEKDGENYTMGRYDVRKKSPRPEGFLKDHEYVNSLTLPDSEKDEIYAHIKSACESGWDFSTRWYVMEDGEELRNGNLSHTRARDIIPVDLNAFLYHNARILEYFCSILPIGYCAEPELHYRDLAINLQNAIHRVLWDEGNGTWFDYDFVRKEKRAEFYPTNISPLWVNASHAQLGNTVASYLKRVGAFDYAGGVPASMLPSGQQWDFPNAWAPLVHILVQALEYSGDNEAQTLAFELAQNWTSANYLGYKVFNGSMYEKYDVRTPGCPGGGGLYRTVLGFGWTNGVILDFLQMYGDRLIAPQVPESIACDTFAIL